MTDDEHFLLCLLLTVIAVLTLFTMAARGDDENPLHWDRPSAVGPGVVPPDNSSGVDPGPGVLDLEVWMEESFEWRWAGVHDIVAPWWHDAKPVELWRPPLTGGR